MPKILQVLSQSLLWRRKPAPLKEPTACFNPAHPWMFQLLCILSRMGLWHYKAGPHQMQNSLSDSQSDWVKIFTFHHHKTKHTRGENVEFPSAPQCTSSSQKYSSSQITAGDELGRDNKGCHLVFILTERFFSNFLICHSLKLSEAENWNRPGRMSINQERLGSRGEAGVQANEEKEMRNKREK